MVLLVPFYNIRFPSNLLHHFGQLSQDSTFTQQCKTLASLEYLQSSTHVCCQLTNQEVNTGKMEFKRTLSCLEMYPKITYPNPRRRWEDCLIQMLGIPHSGLIKSVKQNILKRQKIGRIHKDGSIGDVKYFLEFCQIILKFKKLRPTPQESIWWHSFIINICTCI